MNQEASAMTSTKKIVNPAIESRCGRMKISDPIPIRTPPITKAAKRTICLCRDAPTVETAVSRQVAMAGAPMLGQAMEL